MNLLTMTNPSALSSLLPLSAMTPAERAKGRFMRAPDGHDAGGDTGAASDAGADADAGADTSVLGGAAEADVGADKGGKAGADGADAGGKDDADKAGQPAGAPEKYELKAPEGMDFDGAAFEAAEPTLRELGLSNEQAQKLVDTYAKDIVPKIFERANQNLNQVAADRRKEWNDSFEKDPDIGGPKKDATIAAAARAFDHYGIKKGEGLRQLLDESGLGNHPDMIRFVARIGADLEEGSFERGGATTTPKSAEQKLYDAAFQPK